LQKFVVLMVSLVLAIFGVTVFFSSFTIHDHHIRKLFVGSMGIVTSMSMYSSPLVAVVSMSLQNNHLLAHILNKFSFSFCSYDCRNKL
jgi:solute carrier family 50 (sugar transporter)